MSQAQGKLSENWTTCLTGPASIVFWRLVNTGSATVSVTAAIQDANGDPRPIGQAELAGAAPGMAAGGMADVVEAGGRLSLGPGEKAVAKCTSDQAVSFRITE